MAQFKYLLPLMAVLLFSSPVWAQGNPFAVDSVIEDNYKNAMGIAR